MRRRRSDLEQCDATDQHEPSGTIFHCQKAKEGHGKQHYFLPCGHRYTTSRAPVIDDPREEWRPFVGCWGEGYYSVSSWGRIRRNGEPKCVTPKPAGRGKYLHMRPSIGNVAKNVRVATIVALAFIGPRPSPLHEVNHKNAQHHDNRPENLEWMTNPQNQLHADRNGLRVHSPDARPKLVISQVLEIRARRAAGETQRSIAKAFGLTEKTIRLIEHRRTWRDVA